MFFESIAFKLLLATLMGAVIGMERQLSGKPAGLRTNLLICLGATLLMDMSLEVAHAANLQNLAEGTEFRADPARIAAQIVSGIGFLGAGTILVQRGSVVGLTTAATIWVVAAIGIAIGAGHYEAALTATIITALALSVLGRFEGAGSDPIERIYEAEIPADALADLRSKLTGAEVSVVVEGSMPSAEGARLTLRVTGTEDAHDDFLLEMARKGFAATIVGSDVPVART
jgi:uncharacterized membrane protein YhiD involved in acid resistance